MRAGFVIGDAVDPRDECQVLPHRHVLEEPRFVREEREGLLGAQGVRQQIVAGDANFSGGRRDDAGEGSQGGGLARAVGANEAEHFTGAHRKGEIAHGRETAEELSETGDLDH